MRRGGGHLTCLSAQIGEMEATYHAYMQTYRFFPAQLRSMPVYTVSTVLLTLPYKLRLAIHSCVLTTQYSQLYIARSFQWIMCAYNAVCIVEYDLVIVYDLCTKNIQGNWNLHHVTNDLAHYIVMFITAERFLNDSKTKFYGLLHG